MKNKKIIFSNAYSPRTGHNFASEVFKIFINHRVLIHNKSETRLATFLEAYYDLYNSHIHHKTDKDFFDELFINDLRAKILSKSDTGFVMIKDTSFTGVNHLKKVFPDDIHILLIRDPKAVFTSLFKGMRPGRPTLKNFLKRVATPVGLYPYYYTSKISNRLLKSMPDFTGFEVVRYEDLVLKNEGTLNRLKQLFQSDKSLDEIKAAIDTIEVINTSFREETGAAHIWDAKPKTETFQPLNRKANTLLMEWGIRLGSKQLRKKLNYI